MQHRNIRGQFTNKSNYKRQVRTIRTTDEIWRKFGEMALERGITRADLLEEIVKDEDLSVNSNQAINLLREALKLRPNTGGAIKRKIREALFILDR